MLELQAVAAYFAADCKYRSVAQLGSALDWGSRGRWFESSRSDH